MQKVFVYKFHDDKFLNVSKGMLLANKIAAAYFSRRLNNYTIIAWPA